MPAPWLIPGGIALGGFLADLFSGSDDEQSDKLLKMLSKNAKSGPGVSRLAAPELQGINRQADQATTQQRKQLGRAGLGSTSQATSGAANIFQRRTQAAGGAYSRATSANENSKNRSRAMMLQLLGQRSQQAPDWGSVTGAGIQGLLRGMYNSTGANTGGGTEKTFENFDDIVPKIDLFKMFKGG